MPAGFIADLSREQARLARLPNTIGALELEVLVAGLDQSVTDNLAADPQTVLGALTSSKQALRSEIVEGASAIRPV
jgi:hypothetical protein